MTDLTWRENLVYRYVREFVTSHGYSPTIREIADSTHLASTSSVHYVLSRLQAKGYVRRIAGRQALALTGQVTVAHDDLYNLMLQIKGWIDVDGDEGYERLMAAVGLR